MDLGTAALTIGSVLLGAVLSMGSTIWTTRRDLRRQHRMEIYREVLPAIEGLADELFENAMSGTQRLPWPPVRREVERLHRLALLAGEEDAKHVAALRDAAWELADDPDLAGQGHIASAMLDELDPVSKWFGERLR